MPFFVLISIAVNQTAIFEGVAIWFTQTIIFLKQNRQNRKRRYRQRHQSRSVRAAKTQRMKAFVFCSNSSSHVPASKSSAIHSIEEDFGQQVKAARNARTPPIDPAMHPAIVPRRASG
jgi:hypothetical protein